jgi:hypothetical protein
MERYIEQLIDDFRLSAKKVPSIQEIYKPHEIDENGVADHIATVERYLHGPIQKLSEIVGIEKEALPPAKKLSEEQTQRLFKELEELLATYCFELDLPKKLQVKLKYGLLREDFEEGLIFMGQEGTTLDFCSGDPDECRLPEGFCSCEKLEDFELSQDD